MSTDFFEEQSVAAILDKQPEGGHVGVGQGRPTSIIPSSSCNGNLSHEIDYRLATGACMARTPLTKLGVHPNMTPRPRDDREDTTTDSKTGDK